MALIHDDRTPNDDLALPHPDNDQEDDVLRLREALTAVDSALNSIREVLNAGLHGAAQDLDNGLQIVSNAVEALGLHVDNTKVSKTGAHMTGPLSVPAGASGEQVPQVQEVVKKSGDSMTGNLDFSGNGLRIRGDFTNASSITRLAFQTATENGGTTICAFPNGTSKTAEWAAVNNSDPTSASYARLLATDTEASIRSSIAGAGAYLPLTTYVGGFKNTVQPITGGFLVTGPGGLGYGVGSGGVVEQATSKSTPVTLNKPFGRIKMNPSAMSAGASVTFDVTTSVYNTFTDLVIAGMLITYGNPTNYKLEVVGPISDNTFRLKLTNTSGTSKSEAVEVSFAVIKGANA